MSLTRPILDIITAFDANNERSISFISLGGDQVVGNILTIKNNATNAVVYTATQYTYNFIHTIPAETLTNGGYYNATIKTLNFNANESLESDAVSFYCYTTPLLSITNILPDDIIRASSFEFTGSYYQDEGELLNGFKFILYDSNQNEISNSGLLYTEDLIYTFNGFSNNTSYYIKLIAETINGTAIETNLISFAVQYIDPSIFAIAGLENLYDNGCIQISSNIVAIDGETNMNPVVYIDHTKIDLTDGYYVKWEQGFNIANNFTLSIWGSDFQDNEQIITLSNIYDNTDIPNYITVYYIKNTVESKVYLILKCYSNIDNPYIVFSNKIDIPLTTDNIIIWVRKKDNLFDIKIENLEV